ncbi:MAG: hypothetical protein NZM40_08730 [Sphingomonadaceae bacterium]|uniref:hypothetical protein n=1 Tax=Thermaurantiacus sp. TaxID=2820283 RepID=UPI00298F269B|nr:hypothetical protein [Thermaurantiacus sp.]MCS6987493.1 hypothetical protein [Sphingomonadaceae bacterium]MDW8415094.1 hypothetical protein [Thermaurantiacus sp.]
MSGDPAVLEAWLAVIARDGWRAAVPEAAAAQAGLSVGGLMAEVADRYDALATLLRTLGQASARAAAQATGSVRERLFDGIMAGFDRLQPHRAAVAAIVAARDPAVPPLVAVEGVAALRRLAAVAGVPVSGPLGALRMAALAGLLARVFQVWRDDHTPDMSRTMAELDRRLAEAERVAQEGLRAAFRRASDPPDPGPAPAPDPPAG